MADMLPHITYGECAGQYAGLYRSRVSLGQSMGHYRLRRDGAGSLI
ncbi:MAG: hypothetical protein GAK28_03215 [Luteibacter sp.]|nr:MAG: hypothetical protein GAK28_03215 [Luteibacter sp.]